MINHKDIQEFWGLGAAQGEDFVLLLHQQVSEEQQGPLASQDLLLVVGVGDCHGWSLTFPRLSVTISALKIRNSLMRPATGSCSDSWLEGSEPSFTDWSPT